MRFAATVLKTAALRLISKRASQEYLVHRLTEIPGVPTKMGQLLSMRTGVAARIAESSVMDLESVKERIGEVSPALVRELKALDAQVLQTSLAQVHVGTLRDGRRVIVKLQLPGIRDEIDRQVDDAFDLLRSYGPKYLQSPSLDGFRRYFLTSILEELDYRLEARNQREFRESFSNESGIRVPQVYDELSSESVLVQEYIPSLDIPRMRELQDFDRDRAAHLLAQVLLKGTFQLRRVHADLHPGNWGYVPERRELVLYDFGSVQEVEVIQSLQLRRLVMFDESWNRAAFSSAFLGLGFSAEAVEAVASALPELAALLLEPLRKEGWKSDEWCLTDRMNALLSPQAKWAFRLGGPPWFLGLMRAAQGVLHAANELQARVGYRGVFERVTGESLKYLTATQQIQSLEPLARHLRILVEQDGEEIVSLEFPARSVEVLSDIMPASALAQVELQAIDLKAISKRSVQERFAPGTLFEMRTENRRYRVWLE